MEGSYDLERFIEGASDIVATKHGMEKDEARRTLKNEIEDTGTIIPPACAVPHFIVPGKKKFEICVARCKKGIKFSEDESVTAVFLLMASEDEKRCLFKSIAMIAQMVQSKSFNHLWASARTTDELRDILLLSERTRCEKCQGDLDV